MGSTNVTATSSGTRYAELRYKAWGEIRAAYGETPTKRHYTGHYQEDLVGGGPEGLYYYGARWLDVSLGRWIQPDSVITDPFNPLDFDRYSYVRSNPVNSIDPSGNRPCDDIYANGRCITLPGWNKGPRAVLKLKDWEIKLIALAVASESANGTYPFGAMVLNAQVFINRLVSGLWNQYKIPIWEAVNDTAIRELMIYYPAPESYFKNGGWASEQELEDWVNRTWNVKSAGVDSKGYFTALEAVKAALNLRPTKFIYFSHQHSKVDHTTVQERFNWIIETASFRSASDLNFDFLYYGPFYSSYQYLWILLIVSNIPACGLYGSCGPPWPYNTP